MPQSPAAAHSSISTQALLARGALLALALFLLGAGQPARAQPAQPPAALIELHRLLYDPDFPPSAVHGWLLKRGSPLATMQAIPGDPTSVPAIMIAAASARAGVNPQVLLTWLELRRALSSTNPTFGLPGSPGFQAQVDRAANLLREGLLPELLGRAIPLVGGDIARADPFADPGSYALSRALAASTDLQGWQRLTGAGDAGFVETYRRLFGQDPRDPLPLAPYAGPFLTPPFLAPFEHRSYFDHTYPTVDFGSDSNTAMISYDGVPGRLYDRHDGHDYEFPIGTPVYAAAPGTAYFIRSNDCGDPNTMGVLIRHDSGYETIYWHLSSLSGAPGSNRSVQRGDWLGNSGQSGCASSRPHLHFELRHNGLESDPYGWSGAGSDPCPSLPGQSGGYPGCESSAYAWLSAPDGPPSPATPPPTSMPTATPTSTLPPAATVTPGCGGSSIYTSPDAPKAVPPDGTVGTTTSRLTISGGPTISSLRVVGLNIEHTYASDLDVFLISPAGTRVELFTDICDSGAWSASSTSFTLADDAPAVVGSTCPPGAARYRPEGPLSALIGQPSDGTWTLEVTDDAGFDSGALRGWGLEINSNCPAPTATPPTGCGISFSDVTTVDYFYEPVRYLFCHGIVSGYQDGTFHPFSQVTRAQLLKMVALAEGWNLASPATPSFSDVSPSDWFYTYVETAFARGAISGYSDGTFRPNAGVIRGQIAKIVSLAAGWFLASPAQATFSDVPPGSPYFPYVETAVLRHVISGYSDGTFRPFDPAIRAQIAKTLYIRLTGD